MIRNTSAVGTSGLAWFKSSYSYSYSYSSSSEAEQR